MIYVVAINIQRFADLCRAVNLRGDGKHPVTGEVGMQYLHRAETLHRLNRHVDKVYLSEGWVERADYSNFLVCLKAFRILGGTIEGANLELIAAQQRRNQYLGARPRGDNGLRVVSGEHSHQPRRRGGVVR